VLALEHHGSLNQKIGVVALVARERVNERLQGSWKRADGGNALPVLEASDHALDDVPRSVCCGVERVDDKSRGAAGDDGFDASVLKPSAQAISVAGPVCNEQFGRAKVGRPASAASPAKMRLNTPARLHRTRRL
jgi:hypothetical protein